MAMLLFGTLRGGLIIIIMGSSYIVNDLLSLANHVSMYGLPY